MAAWTGYTARNIRKSIDEDGRWATHTFDIYRKDESVFIRDYSVTVPPWQGGSDLYDVISKAIVSAYKSKMMNAGQVTA